MYTMALEQTRDNKKNYDSKIIETKYTKWIQQPQPNTMFLYVKKVDQKYSKHVLEKW